MENLSNDFMTIVLDPGKHVHCDLCNEDFTEVDTKGGFLFNSTAVCPNCADDFEKSAKMYNEQKYITHRAEENETFRDFVYRMRKRHGI